MLCDPFVRRWVSPPVDPPVSGWSKAATLPVEGAPACGDPAETGLDSVSGVTDSNWRGVAPAAEAGGHKMLLSPVRS